MSITILVAKDSLSRGAAVQTNIGLGSYVLDRQHVRTNQREESQLETDSEHSFDKHAFIPVLVRGQDVLCDFDELILGQAVSSSRSVTLEEFVHLIRCRDTDVAWQLIVQLVVQQE